MKDLSGLKLLSVRWQKTPNSVRKGGMSYELLSSNDNPLATLDCYTQGSFWECAVNAPGERWRFQKRYRSWFRFAYSIQSLDTAQAPVTLECRFRLNKGTLTYFDGRVFYWNVIRPWVQFFGIGKKPQCGWTTADGTPLLFFDVTHRAWQGYTDAVIRAQPAFDFEHDEPKAPRLLIYLGWSLFLFWSEMQSSG